MTMGMNEHRNFVPRMAPSTGPIPFPQDIANIGAGDHLWRIYKTDNKVDHVTSHRCIPQNDGSLHLLNIEEDGSEIIVAAYTVYQWKSVRWGKGGFKGEGGAGFHNDYLAQLYVFLKSEEQKPERKHTMTIDSDLVVEAYIDKDTDTIQINLLRPSARQGASFKATLEALQPLNEDGLYPTVCLLTQE